MSIASCAKGPAERLKEISVPQLPPGEGVHAGGRLVQEDLTPHFGVELKSSRKEKSKKNKEINT